jgi:hypothetical protein
VVVEKASSCLVSSEELQSYVVKNAEENKETAYIEEKSHRGAVYLAVYFLAQS